MTQATEKNPTEQVIELCRALEAGDKTRAAELGPLLDQRHKEMNQGLTGFLNAIEAKGEAFEQKLSQEIAAVEYHFNEYHEALKRIGGYLGDKNIAHLTEGATALEQAAVGLRFAMNLYEERFLSIGPNRFPMINFYSNLARQIKFANKPIELWTGALDRHIDFFQRAVQEVDNSPHKDKPGVPERRAALEKIIAIFNDMKTQGPKVEVESNLFAGDSLLGKLSDTLAALQAAVEAFDAQELTGGPTNSPRANMIIHAVRGVMEKRTDPAVLKSVADAYLNIVQNGVIELQGLSKQPSENEALTEEIACMLEAMEGIEDALMLILSFAEGQEVSNEELEQSLTQLQTQVDKVQEANQKIAAINEAASKVHCPACQHPNPPEAMICQKCRRALPASDRQQPTSSYEFKEGGETPGPDGWRDELVVTTKMKALFDACDGFDKGTVTAEEVAIHLNATEADLSKARQVVSHLEVPDIPDDCPEEHVRFLQEAREMGSEGIAHVAEGIEECQKAVDMLRACLGKHTRAQIEDGMRTYFMGAQKMLKIAKCVAMFLNLGIEKIRETAPELLIRPGEAGPGQPGAGAHGNMPGATHGNMPT